MSCPHCGDSTSRVSRSRAGIETDGIRRRRECVRCGKRFATWERVDRERLELELGETPEAALVFARPPPSWASAELLLHRLWSQAKDRDYVKRDWIAFQAVLTELRHTRV